MLNSLNIKARWVKALVACVIFLMRTRLNSFTADADYAPWGFVDAPITKDKVNAYALHTKDVPLETPHGH
jgi:hypothetical protein